MSNWLIGIVTLIYLGVAVSYCFEGRVPMGVVFFGYSCANIGLIWANMK